MTIDEAIEQFKYDAECNRADLDLSYDEDNEQVAEWLEELKRLRENANGYNKEDIEMNRKAMYNKALDDFVNACKEDILCQSFGLHANGIERIAEQLKEGVDMKIITKKKADEILKRITANEIIGIEYIKDIEAHTKLSENNADIAFEVGGIEGMTKVQNTLTRRYQNEQSI